MTLVMDPVAPVSAAAAYAQRHPPRALVFLVFAFLLAVRIHCAWVQRYSTDADRDVVHLMAKHVAEGGPWPVFFYGQGYMGSLEPLLSALLCKLLGTSAFAVALGTALPAFLIAWAVWLIARAIAGPWAGLYAAAFMATASPAFYIYMGNPRGGYAVAGLLILLCLYLGARLAAHEFRRQRPGLAWYALLGLAAGAAWWTSGIVLPALAVAALLIAVGLRGRLLQVGLVVGTTGFVIGSLPWTLWNLSHHWDSLSMSKSLGAIRLSDSFPLFCRRLWECVGLGKPDLPPYLLGALLLLAALAGLVLPIRAMLKKREPDPWFQLAGVLLFLPLFTYLYVSSSFARIETLRYLLPAIPIAAILFGLALGGWTQRLAWPFHLVLLAGLLAGPLFTGEIPLKVRAEQRDRHRLAGELAKTAKELGIDVVFAPYSFHWINFSTREAVPLVDQTGERYIGYATRGLLAERPGWLADPQGVRTFLRQTASRYKTQGTPLGGLIYEAHPSTQSWSRVAADRIRVTTSGDMPVTQLTDGNLATHWRGASSQQEPSQWVIHLTEKATLTGLKLYSSEAEYPMYIAVYGRRDPQSDWQELQAPVFAGGYHWSGPGLYWENLYQALEVRFSPVTVTELRIDFPPSKKRASYGFQLSELALLEATIPSDAAATTPPDRADVKALVDRLQALGVHQVWADRWVSDRIYALAGQAVRVRCSADLTRELDDPPMDDVPVYARCEPAPGTAFLAPVGAADVTADLLRRAGCQLQVETNRLGVLIVVHDVSTPEPPDLTSLAWFGDALFVLRYPDDDARHARQFFETAAKRAQQSPENARAMLDALLETCPDHTPSLELWLKLADPTDPRHAARSKHLRELTQPDHPCSVRYLNGIRFLGCSVQPTVAEPGARIHVTYFWQAPEDCRYEDLNTFVHFRQDHLVWQDDHEAFSGIDPHAIRQPTAGAPLRVTREITIPDDAPSGSYDLALGLVTRSKARRLAAFGLHAKWNRSIYVEDVLTVTGR